MLILIVIQSSEDPYPLSSALRNRETVLNQSTRAWAVRWLKRIKKNRPLYSFR